MEHTHSDEAHLGESTLRLLADTGTLAILAELAKTPLRPTELDRQIADRYTRSVMMALADAPKTLTGTCRLHIDGEGVPPGSSVDLLAASGRLAALPDPDPAPPAVQGRATPQGWCESLFAGRLLGIAIDGDRELLAVALEKLRDALFD